MSSPAKAGDPVNTAVRDEAKHRYGEVTEYWIVRWSLTPT
jgi:hypothetical protein